MSDIETTPAPAARGTTQRQLAFDPSPEILAVDNKGFFQFPLTVDGSAAQDLRTFDELRLTVSICHPSDKHVLDYDRAYVEVRAAFAEDDHWIRLAEIEPVVPPFNSGGQFDGWVVLPVLAERAALRLYGGGFAPRSRIQVRSLALLVG